MAATGIKAKSEGRARLTAEARRRAAKTSPSEDSVFFQPGKNGNKKYRHLIPGSMYSLTGVGSKNKPARGR